MNWLATSGATNYYIKRDTKADGTFPIIATNTATTFTDTTASGTNINYYAVAAVNAAGTSSDSTIISTESPFGLARHHRAVEPHDAAS